MTFSPRFLQALVPFLGAMLLAACSSEDDKLDPTQQGASGSAGSAGSSTAGASGTAGSAGSAGTAGSSGSAGTGGTASTVNPLCVGPVVTEPSAGLELPLVVAATDSAVFAIEKNPSLGSDIILRSTDGVNFERVIDPPISGILQVAATHQHVYLASWNRLIEGDATLSTWTEVTVPEGT
jgi:hypothetical protein